MVEAIVFQPPREARHDWASPPCVACRFAVLLKQGADRAMEIKMLSLFDPRIWERYRRWARLNYEAF